MEAPWRAFLPDQFQSLHDYACALCDFAALPVSMVMRTSVATRFLLDDTFRELPPEWIPHLRALSDEELALLPQGEVLREEWPESLLSFVRAGKELVVHREPREEALQALQAQLPHLKENSALCLSMKAKKFQEAKSFAPLVASLCRTLGVERVVDIGAGKGYFSQLLATCYGMQVVGVDMNEKLSEDAQKRHAHVQGLHRWQQQKRIKRAAEGDEVVVVVKGQEEGEKQEAEGSGSYRALTVAVGPDTPPSELFAGDAGVAYLLVGMHCCGNLTPSMLRMFTRQRELTGMIQLGCCYHKLTELEEIMLPAVRRRDRLCGGGASSSSSSSSSCGCGAQDGAPLGFPLSRLLQERDVQLMETGRREACHSSERWPQTMENCRSAFRMHLYRTMLQVVLDRFYPEELKARGRDVAVGTIRKTKRGSFAEYAEEAIVRKLKLPFDRLTAQDLQDVEDEFGGRLSDIKIFWTLRGVLGRVLESLILVDRLMFLHENTELGEDQSLFTTLIPAFHPTDSPRNMAIVCARHNRHTLPPAQIMGAVDTTDRVCPLQLPVL